MPKSRGTISFEDKELLISEHSDNLDKKCDTNQKQINIPESILKSSVTSSTTPSVTASSASNKTKIGRLASTSKNVKPNAFMSLEDRDIVVIDNVDYKESTCNEGTVIVLDKPRSHYQQQQQQQSQQQQSQQQRDIDLAELLGNNWPALAGDSALALNNRSTFSSESNSSNSSSNYQLSSGSVSTPATVVTERNRSKNPLNHLGQSKVKRAVSTSTNGNLINLDSDGSSGGTNDISAKKAEVTFDNYDVSSRKANQQNVMTSSVTQTSSVSPKSEHLINLNLDIGSMVEVSRDNCENVYGVIRWIGYIPSTKILSVGVELEDDQESRTSDDGAINGVRLFKCPPGRALFVQPEQCTIDRRFQDIKPTSSSQHKNSDKTPSDYFGQIECPVVEGAVAPLKILNLQDLENITGKFKGIQGHYNSCYLDATLFAMFTFTYVFDSLLFRPPDSDDISNYEEVQRVLREEIVNPLRKNLFVRADRVMKLRELLEKLSSVTGLTCEEKDPEEFLNSLLAQIMKAEPFLKLSSGQDAFYYQLFVEKDERLSFPSVQQLFEQSFLASDIKLKEVPSCLIIQMPRFGKNYKMYPRILPSQVLDVTDIIEDSPRQCCVCGKLAELECRECYGSLQFGAGLESTSFCKLCLEKVHSHDKRTNHMPRELKVPQDYLIMAEHITVPRIFMELFAVVCIETSHYVAFVKCGSGLDAPWCFFDSMADRKGEQNGYNIPEMISVPNLPIWLSEEGAKELNERYLNDKSLPEHAKRLMCDAYMCLYQTDVMMYR